MFVGALNTSCRRHGKHCMPRNNLDGKWSFWTHGKLRKVPLEQFSPKNWARTSTHLILKFYKNYVSMLMDSKFQIPLPILQIDSATSRTLFNSSRSLLNVYKTKPGKRWWLFRSTWIGWLIKFMSWMITSYKKSNASLHVLLQQVKNSHRCSSTILIPAATTSV